MTDMPTLLDAVVTLGDRKQAVVGDATFDDTLRGETNHAGALMLTGTDLDPTEAEALARAMAEKSAHNLALAARHGQLDTFLGGLWLDGVLTGLLLADLRARHEAGD